MTSTMTVQEAIAKALADGTARYTDGKGSASAVPKEADNPTLIEATFNHSEWHPSWEIPLVTRNESNLREWRKRSKRTDAAWKAVSRNIGPWVGYLGRFAREYHSGRPVRCVLTRIGGRTLDRMSNLGSALKAVEDAVCFLIGVDDGDPRWQCRAEQEPGDAYGVRVEFIFDRSTKSREVRDVGVEETDS